MKRGALIFAPLSRQSHAVTGSLSQSKIDEETRKANQLKNYKVRVSPSRNLNVHSSSRGDRHMKNFFAKEESKVASTKMYTNQMKISAYQTFVVSIGVLAVVLALEFLLLPEYQRRAMNLERMNHRYHQPKTVRFDS